MIGLLLIAGLAALAFAFITFARLAEYSRRIHSYRGRERLSDHDRTMRRIYRERSISLWFTFAICLSMGLFLIGAAVWRWLQ